MKRRLFFFDRSAEARLRALAAPWAESLGEPSAEAIHRARQAVAEEGLPLAAACVDVPLDRWKEMQRLLERHQPDAWRISGLLIMEAEDCGQLAEALGELAPEECGIVSALQDASSRGRLALQWTSDEEEP